MSKLFNGLLFSCLSLSILASCGKNKESSEIADSGKISQSISTVKEHDNHEMDEYGFCEEGGEYLGTTVGKEKINFNVSSTQPLFVRFKSLEGYILMPEIDGVEPTEYILYHFDDKGKITLIYDFEAVFDGNYDFGEYLYARFNFATFGTCSISIEYIQIDIADEFGYHIKDDKYLGKSINIESEGLLISEENGIKVEDGSKKSFYRFQFAKNTDYDVLRRNYDGLEINYAIRTASHTYEKVELKELVSTNAFEKSIDKFIYLNVSSKLQTNVLQETYFYVYVYYHTDEYGFDKDGIYHGEDVVSKVRIDRSEYYTYLNGYTWYFRYKIGLANTITYSKDTNLFTYKTYIRNKTTKEMVEVTDIENVPPITLENSDTYEDYIYFTITRINDHLYSSGNELEIKENAHTQHTHDDFGFCTLGGEYAGFEIEVGKTVNVVSGDEKMEEGDKFFARFKADENKKYYRLISNFLPSEFAYYGIVDGEFTPVAVNIQSDAATTIKTDDGYYYIVITTTGTVQNGSFTICELE